jgi:molybdopterin synthase catalytic subunit
MLHTKIVDSKNKKLSINDAEKFISSAEFGASIFFTGTVRNQNNNRSVIGITYDSHDELVIKSFEEIYKDADKKLNIQDKAVFIEHAKGYLNLGEMSIVIAVACKHRDQAYILSRFIIEEIKKRSPIWKKEHYTDNKSNWLKGNPIVHEKN